MSQDEHNELECPHLHIAMDYHIRNYTVSAGSLAFKHWFQNVFSLQHIGSADDFNFTNGEFEGDPLIEVQAHNPMFSIDALEALFESWRAEQVADKSVNHNLRSIKTDSGMN